MHAISTNIDSRVPRVYHEEATMDHCDERSAYSSGAEAVLYAVSYHHAVSFDISGIAGPSTCWPGKEPPLMGDYFFRTIPRKPP
jgi:hypothetical protein